MLKRMQSNERASGAEEILSSLNEDNFIQAKGNFRMKSFSRKDTDEIERCAPNEKPWDTILVDADVLHGILT